MKEELGIVVRESELIDCGNRRFHFEEIFHGRLFKDNQVSKIFVLWKDLEEKDFVFVDHEVSEVKWLDFEKCYQDVKENKINHCIYIEELDIVKKYLRVKLCSFLSLYKFLLRRFFGKKHKKYKNKKDAGGGGKICYNL